MTVSLHEPAVTRLSNGRWGVYCTACSGSDQNWVYPCRQFPDDPEWPPAALIAAPPSPAGRPVAHTEKGERR